MTCMNRYRLHIKGFPAQQGGREKERETKDKKRRKDNDEENGQRWWKTTWNTDRLESVSWSLNNGISLELRRRKWSKRQRLKESKVTPERQTLREADGDRHRNVLHLISTSARDAGKVSQASAPTSTHTSHQHLSLSMKIEKNIHQQMLPHQSHLWQSHFTFTKVSIKATLSQRITDFGGYIYANSCTVRRWWSKRSICLPLCSRLQQYP